MAKAKGPRVEKSQAEKDKIAAEKAAKFVKLAKARTSRAIKAISLIGNLSGSGYSYTEEQVSQITRALSKACGEVASKFVAKGKSAVSAFDFE